MSRSRRGLLPLIAPLAAGPLVVGALALVAYALTLPPGLTWAHQGADGGDLLAAALTGGVPHPTGYPTYQLLLRLAIALAPTNPAVTGAVLSSICAALAVVLLADLGRRVLQQGNGRRTIAAVAASIAALAWGVSPLLWGQATIVEVYALHALFCVSLLWLAARWGEAVESGRSGRRWLTALGLTFGVGLGNHLTLALMAPGLLVLILSARRRLPPTFRRDLALAALAFAGGLLVYLYLPIAASHRPPINWGDPVTFDRLLWVATGRLYASLPFGLPTAQLGTRLFALAGLIVNQFMPWGFLLALFGLFRLDSRRHNWWLATLVTFLAYVIYATAYATSDSEIYLIPAFAVMALWLAEGLSAIFERFGRSPLVRAALIAAAILAVALIPAAAHWQDQLLTQDWQAQNTFRALSEAEPNAVILTAGDRITFALWYAEAQPQQRPDVTVVNVNLYAFDWYRRSLAEKHPDLLPSVGAAPELEALIARWLTERPVYTAEDVGLPLQLGAATPSGILKRVVAVTN